MSLRKTRYIHQNNSHYLSGCHFNGFTAKISPSTEVGMVQVSVSFCSKKDQFCRKTGREAADAAPVFVIPVAHLPTRLAEFETTTDKWRGDWKLLNKKAKRNLSNQWAWIWKYFL